MTKLTLYPKKITITLENVEDGFILKTDEGKRFVAQSVPDLTKKILFLMNIEIASVYETIHGEKSNHSRLAKNGSKARG